MTIFSTWILFVSALSRLAGVNTIPTIQELNWKYDVCIVGPPGALEEGIENPINETEQAYVRKLTTDLIAASPRSMCQDLDLCPVPEKWMIPRASLEDLKDVLKRSTFDVSMEESIKAIPKPSPSEPLNISMSLFIESISSVDEVHNDFSVSMFLVQEWTLDQYRCLNSYKAMAFKGVDVYKRYGNRSAFFEYMNTNNWLPEWPEDQFKLESEHFKLFWMPDIYLANAKSQFAPFQSIDTRFVDVLIRGQSSDKDMLQKRGTFNECNFRYVWKFNAKVSCHMNFLKYPIDVQKCNLQFRSFAYPIQDLMINLMHVEADHGIQLGSQYLSVSFEQNNVWPRSHRHVKAIPGLRSSARIEITLNRSLGSVFVGVMIPALLVVIIDLTMFWIRIAVLSDRIGAGITCLFTLLTQFSATRSAVGTNSYVTLMDWFMIMCIGFVVIQMLQTISVYIIYNREKKRIAELDQQEKAAKAAKATKKQRHPRGKHDEDDKVVSHSHQSVNRKLGKSSKSSKSSSRNSSTCSDYKTAYKMNMNANSLSLRRRRRIVYPLGFKRKDITSDAPPDPEERSEYDVPPKSLEDRLKELRDFLLEPTAQKGTPEYLPMKIDAISRIIFPLLFVFTMAAYGLFAASIDERK